MQDLLLRDMSKAQLFVLTGVAKSGKIWNSVYFSRELKLIITRFLDENISGLDTDYKKSWAQIQAWNSCSVLRIRRWYRSWCKAKFTFITINFSIYLSKDRVYINRKTCQKTFSLWLTFLLPRNLRSIIDSSNLWLHENVHRCFAVILEVIIFGGKILEDLVGILWR